MKFQRGQARSATSFQPSQPPLPAFPAVCQHCGWTRQRGERFEGGLCRPCFQYRWRTGRDRPLQDCPTCGRAGLVQTALRRRS